MALTPEQLKQIKDRVTQDLKKGVTVIDASASVRYLVHNDIRIPMTDPLSAYQEYYDKIINAVGSVQVTSANKLQEIEKVFKSKKLLIYVGKPDTGKTYKAITIGKNIFGEDRTIVAVCGGEMTFTSLLTTVPLNQEIKMVNSKMLELLTDPTDEPALVILDEANLLLTDVLKSMQPLLDTTNDTFTLGDTKYHLNKNCKFIFTMNDKDSGVNILPDAIISRAYLNYFDMPNDKTLAQWTGLPEKFVEETHRLFNVLNLLSLFGTRQLQTLYNCSSSEINLHIKGIIAVKGMEEELVDTPEVQNALIKLEQMR